VAKSDESSPLSLLRRLVANVLSSPEGRKLLVDNPVDQIFVFETTDGAPFMMRVTGDTDSLADARFSCLNF
jgi:hypothetical protein